MCMYPGLCAEAFDLHDGMVCLVLSTPKPRDVDILLVFVGLFVVNLWRENQATLFVWRANRATIVMTLAKLKEAQSSICHHSM